MCCNVRMCCVCMCVFASAYMRVNCMLSAMFMSTTWGVVVDFRVQCVYVLVPSNVCVRVVCARDYLPVCVWEYLCMHEAMLMSATWGVVISFHEQCERVCSCVCVCMCGVCMWGFASMCMRVFVYAWDKVDVYYMSGHDWLSLKCCVHLFVCVCVRLTGKLRFDGAIPFSANRCSRPGRECACTHTHIHVCVHILNQNAE